MSSPTTRSPTATRPPGDLRTAAGIVHSRRARLDSLAVIPGHPGRRIAEWYTCSDRRCYHRTYALVVSSDGFTTSHVVAVGPSRVANGWYLEPAGPDHFTIAPNGGRRSLVDLTGHQTSISVSGPPGPLVGREVAVRKGTGLFLAVDPVTGEAHPLFTPKGVVQVETTSGGQLRAVTLDHPRYYWSSDGGATWHQIPLPPGTADLSAQLVPTPSDSLHVLVLGGENTVFPWGRVLRSIDGRAWTSYAGPTDPTGFIDQSVVLPDDRLLMNVGGWSDETNARASVNPFGFWAGTDWSRLEPVAMGAPFAGREPTLVDIAVTGHRATLYALASDQRGSVASTDGGASWRAVRTR